MMKTPEESLLANLYLAAPCSIKWESMQGNQRRRDCTGCSRAVFNISDMTKAEAESFLRENGANPCMIFYRRADGTIMTDNCPVGLRKLRDKCKILIRVAAGVLTFVLTCPGALAETLKSRLVAQTATTAVVTVPAPLSHPGIPGRFDAQKMGDTKFRELIETNLLTARQQLGQ